MEQSTWPLLGRILWTLHFRVRPLNVQRMRIVLLLVAATFMGCAHHDGNAPKKMKASAHIYNGDSPNIHYQSTQTAGGPLETY